MLQWAVERRTSNGKPDRNVGCGSEPGGAGSRPGRVGAARSNPRSSRESPTYEGVGHRSISRSRADSLVRRSQLGLARRAGAGTQIRRRLIPRGLFGRADSLVRRSQLGLARRAGAGTQIRRRLIPRGLFGRARRPDAGATIHHRSRSRLRQGCARTRGGYSQAAGSALARQRCGGGSRSRLGQLCARTRCGFSEVADSAGAGRRCGASEIGRGCRTLGLSSRRFAIVRSGIDDIHHAYTRIARRVGATGIGLGSVHRHDDSRIPHELAAVPGRQIFRSRTTPQGAQEPPVLQALQPDGDRQRGAEGQTTTRSHGWCLLASHLMTTA